MANAHACDAVMPISGFSVGKMKFRLLTKLLTTYLSQELLVTSPRTPSGSGSWPNWIGTRCWEPPQSEIRGPCARII